MIQVSHLLVAVLITISSLHAAHAWHPAAKEVLQSWDSATQTPRVPAAMHDSEDMLPVKPFEVEGATVHGPVGDDVQAELLQMWGGGDGDSDGDGDGTAGAGRALLHGSKKLKKYTECRKCRMVRCNRQKGFCSGHCRKGKTLRYCSSNSVVSPMCLYPDPPVIEDFIGEPPTDMAEFDTAVVSAPAPYMGCADIGNRPSGCPARDTRVTMDDGGSGRVVWSRCRSEYYIPDCLGPLMPLGICECVYLMDRSEGSSRRRILLEPCKTTELEDGAGVGDGDGDDDVVVVAGDDVTETRFSDYADPGQEADHEHTVKARSRSTKVDVTLRYYTGIVMTVDYTYEVHGDDSDLNYDDDDEPESDSESALL